MSQREARGKMASKRVYVVTNPVDQGLSKGKWKYHFYVMDEKCEYECGGFHSKKSMAEEKMRQLQKDTTVLLQKFSISQRDQTAFLTINDQTNVFQTNTNIQISEQRLVDFFNPPSVSLAALESSPRKRKVSVTGTIAEVHDEVEGPTWKRKDVYLTDDASNKRICLKLWGKQTESVTPADQGQTLTATNATVDKWQNTTNINTNELTSIEITNSVQDGDVVISVIGLAQQGNTIMMASEDGDPVQIQQDIFNNFTEFDDLLAMLPKRVTVTYANGVATRLEMVE